MRTINATSALEASRCIRVPLARELTPEGILCCHDNNSSLHFGASST